MVVCDDVYECLTFEKKNQAVPPRLVSLDTGPGCVVSNGTFSKIFAPGIRVGWIEAPTPLVQKFTSCFFLQSGGSPNHFSSCLLSSMIELGISDRFLQRLRRVYSERCKVMCDTLASHLPPEVSFSVPSGGFFVWITLPSHMDASSLLDVSWKRYKVAFLPGIRASPSGTTRTHCLRLSFAYYPSKTIEKACRQLCSVIVEAISLP